MRIAGVNLPKDKEILTALTYIYGIGSTSAEKILKTADVASNIRTKDLTSEQEDKIRSLVEKNHKIEGDLKREIAGHIKRLKEIKSFRGLRHKKGLPVRGQRTKTNSRTVRGNKRQTMGSGRVKAAQKT